MMPSIIFGKDLGVYGETFVIAEKSLVEHIKEKLQFIQDSGALDHHQKKIQKKVKETLTHPKPVEGIVHTYEARTFIFDPSIVLQQDFKNHKGEVFYKKGTRINPLTHTSLTKPLLFIDGDSPEHLKWLKRQIQSMPFSKIILIKGNPFKLMESMDKEVFFDQGGVLVSKLGISQIPARVVQNGEILQITEEFPDA